MTDSVGTDNLEIEHKYLIHYPDAALLASIPGCRVARLSQTYLLGQVGESTRVRCWQEDGVTQYFLTVKRRLSALSRSEIESEISREDYETALRHADPARRTIEKVRYILPADGLHWEVDVFPFWTDKAIAELEVPSEETPVRFPPYLTVICEVSADNAYTNGSLALRTSPLVPEDF